MGQISYTRGYGVANIFVLQSDTAFEKTYGKDSFKTLWNNCEIVLALPGQRGTDILSLLETTIGKESYIAESMSRGSSGSHAPQVNLSENTKPVFDQDEIRRTNKGVLRIRGNHSILVDVPAYAALDPIRDVAEINPLHGKPFLLPVAGWFKSSPNWPIKRVYFMLLRFWKRISRRHVLVDPALRKRQLKRRALLFRLLAMLCSFWWVFALVYLYFETSVLHRIAGGVIGGL